MWFNFERTVTNVAITVQVWRKNAQDSRKENVYKHARLRNANHAVKTNRKLNSPFWESTCNGRSRFRFGNCQRTIAIKAFVAGPAFRDRADRLLLPVKQEKCQKNESRVCSFTAPLLIWGHMRSSLLSPRFSKQTVKIRVPFFLSM